ncbi:3-keto-5-aminohexanoate cleavage protein [Pseudotabrizicola sediminis]|uniref:3-keto-5-aminohexanoate cleavage protein n=1 Tax=Pseudotabrizicola sediminis TaxID=2486418 RepID=A0ABY2KJB6_9RHOB|nr:3-keto-5-aminohexanoate cleavage protein [Pseudotabrizicola sediminis]TGD42488.1 3-keto-5-aminohexanoate cleavage protein [Pseudotabrizicola sediminis]
MMLPKVIITCAVTGNLATRAQHPGLPATPEEIAQACLDAADAGASIAHIHVRAPVTAAPSMDLELYARVVALIRARNSALILNLTTGPGGRYVPSDDNPAIAGPGTTLLPPEKRVEHITALKPEICTLDLNTMNSGGQVVINTPRSARIMAAIIREAGVKPEIELFDTGDIGLAQDMLQDGSIAGPMLCSIVTGVKYGLPSTPDAMATAARMLPPGSIWTGFGIGRMAFPMLVQSWLLGGHVRIGMEDTSYISKGQLTAGNGELTERARDLIEKLGGQIATPDEARAMLGLQT